MPSWRKVIVSGSDASLNSLNVATNVVAQSFTGSLFGTSSWANNAVSSSYSLTASYALNAGGGGTGFPFTGSARITGSLVLTGSLLVTQSYISTVDYIDFTLTADPAHNEGRIHWIDDTKTLNVDTDVNNFYIELGHQNVVRVNNQNSFTLTKGTVVYINGENGQRPTVATASFENDALSAATLGLVAQNINSGQNGYVISAGLIRGINTNAYAPGTMLYLSSSGQFSSTIPQSPLHEVRLGKTITQATDGTIFIDVMNGYELGELHDVLETNRQNGDLIVFDSGSRVYKNSKILSGSYGVSGSLTVSQGITGSLLGTSSYATQALSSSYALTASYALGPPPFPYTGSAAITGSLILSGSMYISSSLFQYADNTDVDIGTEVVLSVETGSYRSAFFDYVISSGSNARAGTVMSVWGSASIDFTEASTNDIGTTTDVTLSTILSGSFVQLQATTLSNNWTVKSLVRML